MQRLKTLLPVFMIGLLALGQVIPSLSAESKLLPEEKQYLFLGNAHYPPFIYLENAQPVGLVADLALAVIEKGGIRGQLEAREWKQAQEDVRAGGADALVLINRTPERDAYLDFSAPLITARFVLFRKSDRIDITGVESLKQKTVGVERGGYTTSIMRKFSEIQLREVGDNSEGFDLLHQGAIDALITERWAGMYALSRGDLAGIALIERPVETSVGYIAVRKGNQALLEKINLGLERIERDGTRQAILDRWSGKQVLYVTRDKIDYYRLTQWLAVTVIALLSFAALYSRRLARRKREAIEKQNAELELRVANRTRDLQTARAEAERATASRTQFMANVSHEMRTPLQGILGFAAVGKHSFNELSEAELAECFDRITESGQRMHRLVESMLTLAEKSWKNHRAFTDEYPEALRLDTLAHDCVQAKESQAMQRNQVLRLDASATTQTIHGDAARLRQVMDNLIDNALRYSPAGSTITLRILDATLPGDGPDAPRSKAVALEVVDEGLGIPVGELDQIFEPFYQGSHTATKAGGTGLGLPICKKIVEQHGGTLKAVNRPEGGAIFAVKLPCSAHAAACSQADASIDFGIADISSAQRDFQRCTRSLLESRYRKDPDSSMKSHAQCPFGQWLSGPGQPFSLFEQYHELTALHVKLHAIAERTVELANSGRDNDSVQALEDEFAAISRQMILLLDTLNID